MHIFHLGIVGHTLTYIIIYIMHMLGVNTQPQRNPALAVQTEDSWEPDSPMQGKLRKAAGSQADCWNTAKNKARSLKGAGKAWSEG